MDLFDALFSPKSVPNRLRMDYDPVRRRGVVYHDPVPVITLTVPVVDQFIIRRFTVEAL